MAMVDNDASRAGVEQSADVVGRSDAAADFDL